MVMVMMVKMIGVDATHLVFLGSVNVVHVMHVH